MEKSSIQENKRVLRIKKILEDQNLTQKDLADALNMEPQNFSRFMVSGKVSEKTCRKIIALYPEYRIEWLLGYDDFMTLEEYKNTFIQRKDAVNAAVITILDAAVREVCARENIDPPQIDNIAEFCILETQLRDFADSLMWNYIVHRQHSHLWNLLDQAK